MIINMVGGKLAVANHHQLLLTLTMLSALTLTQIGSG